MAVPIAARPRAGRRHAVARRDPRPAPARRREPDAVVTRMAASGRPGVALRDRRPPGTRAPEDRARPPRSSGCGSRSGSTTTSAPSTTASAPIRCSAPRSAGTLGAVPPPPLAVGGACLGGNRAADRVFARRRDPAPHSRRWGAAILARPRARERTRGRLMDVPDRPRLLAAVALRRSSPRWTCPEAGRSR